MEANEINSAIHGTPEPEKQDPFAEIIGAPSQHPIDEAAFGEEPTKETPKQENEEVVPHIPQPVPAEAGQEAPNNDDVRYQYWQSQATKLKNQLNEVEEYKPLLKYVKENPDLLQKVEQREAAKEEEFPNPPDRPVKPTGYSREEAFNDPSSASAQYLDQVEVWQDQMNTYNQLASQYQMSKMQEVYDNKLNALEKMEAERSQHIRQQNEMANIKDYVKSHYDLGDNLDGFIRDMSDPSSINMDDLVGYYKYKNGIMGETPQNVQASPQFQQTQRAQQVPSPMGVIPSSNTPTQAETTDFIGALQEDHKNSNPF